MQLVKKSVGFMRGIIGQTSVSRDANLASRQRRRRRRRPLISRSHLSSVVPISSRVSGRVRARFNYLRMRG